MIILKPKKFVLTFTATCFFLAAPMVIGQQTDQKPSDQQVSSLIMRGSIHQILARVALNYKVPIGLKVIPEGTEGEISIRIGAGSVRDVLNSIIEADPRYKWEETGGVVNVLPRSDSDDFLATVIAEFQIGRQSQLDLRQALFDSPEVKSKLDSMGVRPLNTELMSSAAKDVFSITPVVLSNATVKDVLNHVIKCSNVHYWVISRFGDNKGFLIINF